MFNTLTSILICLHMTLYWKTGVVFLFAVLSHIANIRCMDSAVLLHLLTVAFTELSNNLKCAIKHFSSRLLIQCKRAA